MFMRIIAHRGSSARAPENTAAALRAAIEDGADGVEVDVRLTRDDEVVLMHDPDLLRTTGDPRPIAHATMLDLSALNAGAWFGPDFAGEKIPTLDAALELLPPTMALNIELKAEERGDELSDAVTEIVTAHAALDRCWLSSSDDTILARIRARCPSARLGRVATAEVAAKPLDGLQFVAAEASAVDVALIAQARAARAEVWAWTVNDPVRAAKLGRLGVAAIITDDPALLRAAMGSG